ncbi:MAG TPA: RDD family protein [Flavisolibacter sp.]|jgi:uncharacterized RDD family membrane protein YckC|nr:RDD family protein [Flavisolibacter sp.]
MYTEAPFEQNDLFTEEDVVHYIDASTGQRFLNLLLDTLVLRYLFAYPFGIALGYLLLLLSAESVLNALALRSGMEYYFFLYLLGSLMYIIYYTFCEKVFRGYTLGKLITGTRAIRNDGKELTFKDALLRSLCRVVPFEAFSGFAVIPWHDRWTGTVVVKVR